MDLNKNQELAMHCRENLLIVAGAGTGKTKTLISKMSHYINQGFVLPHQIIATTFTNKATQEIRKRLEDSVGMHASQISIGTFHKLSLNIVQENAELLGFKEIQVLPYDDQLQLIRKISNHMKYKGLKPSQLLDTIQRAKEKNVFDNLSAIEHDIHDIYAKTLKSMNAMDFADLLSNTIKLWENNPEILKQYQERYKLICVDEYQDINEAQHHWLQLLSNDQNQICCVGDPDQAIYAFRGSDIKYILNFSEDFTNSKKIVLDQNYRSTDKIIKNSNSIIKHNKKRLDKTLFTNITSNRNVDVFIGMHEKEESNEICKLIAQEKSENPQATIGILFRTSAQMDSMEESLLNANIKYTIVGSIQLLDRAEVKDAISYVRFLANPSDLMAFNRMTQTPKRGIGLTTLDKIAESPGDNVEEKILNLSTTLNQGTFSKLESLLEQWKKWRSMNIDFPTLMEKIIHESGLFEASEKHRQENLVRWLDSISEFKSAEEYINYILWSNIKSDDDNDVQLMTVHAAKGLEFDIVFLPGWEEGLFPHVRSRSNTEEERRLAYVAITRAKSYLAISYVQSRMQHGRYMSSVPSRFIRELDSSHVTFKSFKQKGMVGKKVFHDVLGYGMIEEVGANHAQVRFGNNVKVVELKSLIQCQ